MYINAEITDRRLKNNEDFVWAIEVPLTGKFIIDVEFLDLKITSPDVSIYLLILTTILLYRLKRIITLKESHNNFTLGLY